jgi:LmbE family N-acetylglucosaminyl deacetylase
MKNNNEISSNINVTRTFYHLFKVFILNLIKTINVTRITFYQSNYTIIIPHPDDEIFGLGGFLLEQSQKNVKISLVYLTDGEASLEDVPKEMIAQSRIKISSDVLKQISPSNLSVFRLHLPDGKVPFNNDQLFASSVNNIKEILTGVQPDAVFVTHPADFWPYDHVAAFELAKQALIELNFTGKFYGYWVWLWYNYSFRNFKNISWKNTFKIPIHPFLNMKKILIGMYMDPMAPNGKPYSGLLPKAFLAAFSFPFEMVTEFKIKPDVEN